MDSRREGSGYPSRGNPIIYGTDHAAAGQLPRTSYDLLNQNLPAELSAAQTRRCLTLKKQMQMSCKLIDMNSHFVEQTLKRRGGVGILRLCEKAITDSYKSLQKAADELIDILGYTDCEVVEVLVYELMADTQDCVESVLITLEDFLEPFRDSERDTITMTAIGAGQPPPEDDERQGTEEPQHLSDVDGVMVGVEVDRGMIGDQQKSAEKSGSQTYTDREERCRTEREYDEEKDYQAGDPWEAEDDGINPRMITRECGRDEIDVREQPHVRDVKQQEKGKELDELAVLRYHDTTDLAQDAHAHSHSGDLVETFRPIPLSATCLDF